MWTPPKRRPLLQLLQPLSRPSRWEPLISAVPLHLVSVPHWGGGEDAKGGRRAEAVEPVFICQTSVVVVGLLISCVVSWVLCLPHRGVGRIIKGSQGGGQEYKGFSGTPRGCGSPALRAIWEYGQGC